MVQLLEVANIFDEMGSYWAEISGKSHTEQQIRFLKNQLKGRHYVLDLACGTGRHTILLRSEGYSIVGLDASVNLLRIGKQRNGGAMLVCGDMRFLPFNEATFSAAISMDTSVGYLPTEKEDVESLAETRRVLKRDGVFIVDVFNRLNLTSKYQDKVPSTKTIEYQSFHLQQKRQLSGDGKLLCDTWTIRGKTDGETRVFKHIVRLYDYEQLEGFLESTGFDVKRVFGNYEGQDFSAYSSRLIVVAAAR
ncbi:MAG TPA: class I SAM-dependent methyltransferase [Candidatus Deferrimicrobiaceae bacterium]|nr:class I SAM-dependent methyltransferase [Candidatus Deferrimicrobiaceae bacterium]